MAVIVQANDQFATTQNAVADTKIQADTTNIHIAASAALNYIGIASQTSFLIHLQNLLSANRSYRKYHCLNGSFMQILERSDFPCLPTFQT